MEEHRPKKLLEQVREAIRLKLHSYCTEQAYVGWIKPYSQFDGVRPRPRRHPELMEG